MIVYVLNTLYFYRIIIVLSSGLFWGLGSSALKC